MRSHTLTSFFPGVFLGAVIGLIFGSLWATSLADAEIEKLRQAYESNAVGSGTVVATCELSSKTLSFTSAEDGKQVTVKAGGDVVETLTFDGPVAASIYDQNDEYAYISVTPDGLGGYIIYPSYFAMYRVDLCNGEVKVLTELMGEQALALSPDETMVAVSVDNRTIAVHDIASGETKATFVAPEAYGTVGDVHFSPDSSKIAFGASFNDPEAEGGIVYVGTIATERLTQYESSAKRAGEGEVHVRGWLDNERVDWY